MYLFLDKTLCSEIHLIRFGSIKTYLVCSSYLLFK